MALDDEAMWQPNTGLGQLEEDLRENRGNLSALRTIQAPPFVADPEIRGTMTILWSCILTLTACIYTALHLNVPGNTKAMAMLREKLKWVLIGLIAPEVVLYLASSQFLDARRLSRELTMLWREQMGEQAGMEMEGTNGLKDKTNPCFDIRYGFFVIMGGLEVDISKIQHFTARWAPRGTLESGSLRLSVNGVLQLAKLGHFIPIPRSKIDDKSKADTLQKFLVMSQIAWMATQCIVRKSLGLPVSLLEIHTMVHVVCAVIMFIFWFKKPKDMLDPEMVNTAEFNHIISLMVQEQFHFAKSEEFIFYPKTSHGRQSHSYKQPAFIWIHHTDPNQRKYLRDEQNRIKPVEWVGDEGTRLMLKTGEVLPSGLGVVARTAAWEVEKFQRRVLPSWFDGHSYDDPWDIPDSVWITEYVEAEPVAPTADLFAADILRWENVIAAVEYLEGTIGEPELFHRNYQQVRYPDQNFHDAFTRSAGNFQYTGDSRIDPDQLIRFIISSPILLILLLVLPGIYGGIHLLAVNSPFPSKLEQLLWKIASFDIIATMPVFFMLTAVGSGISRRFFEYESIAEDSWATFYKLPGHIMFIAYGLSRAFLVVESFISLRAVPIGTYWTPSWLQTIPHAPTIARRDGHPPKRQKRTYFIQRLLNDDPENDTTASDFIRRTFPDARDLSRTRINSFVSDQDDTYMFYAVGIHRERSLLRIKNILDRVAPLI
ncbi:hypothetical protein ACJ41O_014739 [Fusarium nematophilum]